MKKKKLFSFPELITIKVYKWAHPIMDSENILLLFTLSNAKHGGKYWNRSRGKLDFEGSSGKDYGTDGLN